MAALDGATPAIIGAAGAAGGGGDFTIERSLRFNDDDTAYLNRTPSGASNTKTWTWSAWTKRSKINAEANLFSVGASSTDAAFRFNADDTLQVRDGGGGELTTSSPFLDPSAWYHIVVALDNLQSTASDRFRLYVNGVEVSLGSASYAAQNTAGDFNTAVAHYIGRQVHNTSNLFDGYLTQINFVDGRQLAPTEFGEYDDNNVWQPKEYTSFNNPNASTTWSDAVPTADGFRPGRAAADAFDNDLSTYCALNNYTFNLDVGSWSTSGTLEVYTGANHEYAVDGGSTSAMNADDWTTVGDAGSITTLTLTRTDGGYPYINAVRINGYVLIDSAVDNSFQLKFDDNSSTSALGTDSSGNSNTWTVNNFSVTDNYAAGAVTAAWAGYVGAWATTDTWSSLGVSSSFGGTSGTKGYSTTTETWTGAKTIATGDFGSGIRGGNGWAIRYPTSVTVTIDPAAQASLTDIVVCPDETTDIANGTSVTTYPATVTGQVFWYRYSGAGYPAADALGTVTNPGATTQTDSLIDTPMNYTADSGNNGGNYPSWNPLDTFGPEFSNGNLDASYNTTSWKGYRATTAVTSGKWYWEVIINTLSGSNYTNIGVSKARGTGGVAINSDFDNTAETAGYNSTGAKVSSTYGGGTYGDSFTAGDVIGVAFDVDAGTLIFYKNNVSQGTAYSTLTANASWNPAMSMYGNVAVSANFGQRPFRFTPPTDYLPLVTTNLGTPGVTDGSTAMDSSLYTGDGNAGQTVSGLSMAPDFVWFKSRSEARNNAVFDIVRGVERRLQPNITQLEDASTTGLTAFDSDGFTFGSNNVNGRSGVNYVAWSWDAGTSTVSNSDGTITSNVRANTTTGFSVVEYTGNGSNSTVGHGLGAAPEFIIVKLRDDASGWAVYHDAIGTSTNNYIELQSTAVAAQDNTAFQNTAPTSSVFSIGTKPATNNSGDSHVAYCWAPVSQYSSFGSYTGETDLFIHTGFKPQWLMIKSYAGDGYNWVCIDNSRGATTGNVSNKLYFNLDNYENDDGRGTETKVVFLSNGFTFLDASAETNSSTRSYIYAAFAEHPFKSSRGGFQNIS